MRNLWLILISCYCFNFWACAAVNQADNNVTRSNQNVNTSLTNLPTVNNNADNTAVYNNLVLDKKENEETLPQQGVRSFDFNNFTYHWFPKYGDVIIKRKIVLHNGENESVHIEGPGIMPNGDDYKEVLADVSYADLTGDGKEEAIVTVAVSFYKWNPQCIFIFGEKNKKPILLWQYETDVIGKNTEWRGHKIKDGKLIIEEFDTKYRDPAPCCSYRYFQKTFAWNGKTFEEKNIEIIPYNKTNKDFSGYPSDSGYYSKDENNQQN